MLGCGRRCEMSVFDNWYSDFTTRLAPTRPRTFGDVLRHWEGRAVTVDHEGRITDQQLAEINADFASYGVEVDPDISFGRITIRPAKKDNS
jgi:hypothetical protein